MRGTYKAFLLWSMTVFSRKSIHVIVWITTWTSHLFPHWDTNFIWKKWLTDTLCLFRLGYLEDIFLTKWTCHCKENNWHYLLPMIKFEVSSENQNSGKLVSTTVSLTTFQYLRTSLMKSVLILKMSFLWYCKNIWCKCKN